MIVFRIAWLTDGSGLVIPSPGPNNAEDVGATFQLWALSLADGNLRKITNDLNDYQNAALTGNSTTLATSQKQMRSSIWVASATSPSEAEEITAGAGRMDGVRGLSWLPEGRLLYMSSEPNAQIWQMDRDGSHRQQITHSTGHCQDPSASADGATLVFSQGGNIWRMSIDGGNAEQVTAGSRSMIWNSEISPDGKWVTYYSNEGGPAKALLHGENITALDPEGGGYPTISADGHWIAFQHWDEKAKQLLIEIISADGMGAPRFLPFMPPGESQVPTTSNLGTLPIRWTASGDALTYVRTKNGVSNLWSQSIHGGPAKQITNFRSGLIWRHAWSRDGKYLALARGSVSIDAILLTDLR